MASFDIIDSVGHAYRFLWVERRYIARLAAVPVIVKLGCQLAVEATGNETNFIRQALILLPSLFFDGWMFSHVVRFALFGQRWPFRPTGRDDMMVLRDKAQGILTGIATYVLTRFLILGLMAALYALVHTVPPGEASAPEPVKIEAFAGLLIIIAGGLWAFRLLWLYIPAAANVPLLPFLQRIRGFSISLRMLGTAIVSFLPMLVVFIMAASLLAQMTGGASFLPPGLEALLSLYWVCTDTAIGIVMTFAITIGLRPFMQDRETSR